MLGPGGEGGGGIQESRGVNGSGGGTREKEEEREGGREEEEEERERRGGGGGGVGSGGGGQAQQSSDAGHLQPPDERNSRRKLCQCMMEKWQCPDPGSSGFNVAQEVIGDKMDWFIVRVGWVSIVTLQQRVDACIAHVQISAHASSCPAGQNCHSCAIC